MQTSAIGSSLGRRDEIPIDGGYVISDAGSRAQKCVSGNDAQIPIGDLIETAGFDHRNTNSWIFCQTSSDLEDLRLSIGFEERVFIHETGVKVNYSDVWLATQYAVTFKELTVLPAVPPPTTT